EADPPSPWLRAVRPPPVPLDAGVIEEYRTAHAGRLAWSADASAIGGLGRDGAVAWERATRRRTTPPPVVPPGHWIVRRDSTWGRCVLEGADRRIAIEHGDDENVRGVIASTPMHAIVALDDAEGDSFHALVDVTKGYIVWRQYGTGEHAAIR